MAAPKKPYTNLNQRVHRIVVAAGRAGLSKRAAAAKAGVHVRTLQDWLARGGDEAARGEPTPYARLYLDYEGAQAEWEEEMCGHIDAAAATHAMNWAAAATRLERKMPEEYGQRDTLSVELSQPLIEINVTTDHDATDHAIALFERLAAISKAGGTGGVSVPRALPQGHPDIIVPDPSTSGTVES